MSDPQELYNTLRAQTEARRAAQEKENANMKRLAAEWQARRETYETAERMAVLEEWVGRAVPHIREEMQTPQAQRDGCLCLDMKDIPFFMSPRLELTNEALTEALKQHFVGFYTRVKYEEVQDGSDPGSGEPWYKKTGRTMIVVSWQRQNR